MPEFIKCATCGKDRAKAYCISLRPEREAWVCFDCCRAITSRMVVALKEGMNR